MNLFLILQKVFDRWLSHMAILREMGRRKEFFDLWKMRHSGYLAHKLNMTSLLIDILNRQYIELYSLRTNFSYFIYLNQFVLKLITCCNYETQTRATVTKN